jgi:DNA polymerase-1
VHEVFDALQFRVLRERLYATLESAEPEADAGFDIEVQTLAPGELGLWLTAHTGGPGRTGLAVAGRWGSGTGDVTGIALAAPDGAGCWFDAVACTADDDIAMAAWCADPGRGKVLHDAKGPSLALAARGWPVAGLSCDTALSAYLVLPGQRSFDLADLVLRFLHLELRTEADDSGQLSFEGGEDEAAAEALAVKARAVVDLAEALDAELAGKGQTDLLRDVELPLVGVLVAMERTGIAIDGDHLAGLEAHFAGEVKAAAQEYAVVGREFNLGSPKQLQVVLFDELGMPKTKRIKTGYTTDADALQGLCTSRPSTRSWSTCCATATSPGSTPSTGC